MKLFAKALVVLALLMSAVSSWACEDGGACRRDKESPSPKVFEAGR